MASKRKRVRIEDSHPDVASSSYMDIGNGDMSNNNNNTNDDDDEFVENKRARLEAKIGCDGGREFIENTMNKGHGEKDMSDSDDEDNPDAVRTLDSDEEAEVVAAMKEKRRRKALTKIRGQEEDTIGLAELEEEDGTRITPFNLREEMETGQFDQSGHYVEDKEDGEVHDSWLDSMDMSARSLKRQKDMIAKHEERMAQLERDDSGDSLDKFKVLSDLLSMLQQGESVMAALRRLGVASKELKKLKMKIGKKKDDDSLGELARLQERSSLDSADLQNITELANKLMQAGDTAVYDHTPDKIKHLLKVEEERRATTSGAFVKAGLVDEVMWEYKWKNEEDCDVHGPFSSSQMLEWSKQGYFPEPVFVRRTNRPNSSFTSSTRVDFDLYT